jgi:hypothetical protein
MRLLRMAASLLALCLLQSCGGGGGGGGASSGGGNDAGFTITLDRTAISFEAFEGGSAATQIILATAHGEYTHDELFVGATVEGQGIDPTIQVIILSETTARIEVNAASGLAAGTYSGRVILHACSDEFCNNHVGGTPLAVNYTITIKTGLKFNPPVLQLTSVSGFGTSDGVSVQLPEGATAYSMEVSDTQLHWLSVPNPGGLTFSVSATSLPVGNYVGVISGSSFGSTAVLRVEYTVTEPFGGAHGILAPQSLALSTSEGAQVSETMLVTPPTWNPGLRAAVVPVVGPPVDWLTVTPTTDGFTVTASAASLAQGSYSAQIHILTVPEYEAVVVPVTFTVGPGFVQPAPTVIEVDSDSTPAQLSGRIRIDVGDGSPIGWTASTAVPWLTLTRATGLTGTDVEFTIDRATFDAWDNFTDHAATIHVAGASSTLTPIDCDVNVQLRMAEVTGVGPYLLIEGQSSKVIVRGRGFEHVADPFARLRIDSGAAVSATRVNDTQLAVDVGALALGTHTVHVTNALNRALQTRAVKVIPVASYAYKAMPLSTSFVQWPFMYDAERQNAYVQANFFGLVRFPVTSASTVAEPLPGAGGYLLGLTADGANYVTGDQTRFALLDPGTLAVVPGSELDTIDLRPAIYGTFPMGTLGLMVSNDSRLWYEDFHWLRLDSLTTGRVTDLAPGTPGCCQQDPLAMSRNGARIVGIEWSSSPVAFETFPLYYLDTADSVLHYRADPVMAYPQIMLSDDGERVLINYFKVLDAQLQDFGDIVLPPSASAYDPLIAAISPDGTRVYLLTYERTDYNNPTPTHDPRVYVFDSSAPVSAPQTLPVLGYFEFDDYPGCMRSDCFSATYANITPDGGALLFVGNRNLVVVPTDAGLTAAVTAPGNQKTRGASTLRTVRWRK